MFVLSSDVYAEKIMATRPRRIRNLNLPEVEDVEPAENEHGNLESAENEHDNPAENENNENLQGPPDIDGLLARMPRYHPRSPIKIICKFHDFSFHIQMQCENKHFHICRAKWRGAASFR